MKLVEMFSSLQGEGINTGKRAIFIRFAECNKKCKFCDTEFAKYEEVNINQIIKQFKMLYTDQPLVVITGGEPLLHTDEVTNLVACIKTVTEWKPDFELETNGSLPIPYAWFEYVSVSPKQSRDDTNDQKCTSLKLLFPYIGKGITGDDFRDFPVRRDGARFLQLVSPWSCETVSAAMAELERLGPGWRLGCQMHKQWRVL